MLRNHILKNALSHGEDIGWDVMPSLRNGHEGKLAVGGASVVAAGQGAVRSLIVVDLSIQSVEILCLEILGGGSEPRFNGRGAVTIVPLASIDKNVRAGRAKLVVKP